MKTILISLISLLGGSLYAQSIQSTESEKLQPFSVDLTFASKFVYRGGQLVTNAIHPSLEYANERIYAGYWGGYPTKNRATEDTYHIFYAGALQPVTKSALVDFGAMQYVMSDSPDATEVYAGITKRASRFNTVMPGAYAYYNFESKALTLQGNADYGLKFRRVDWPVNLNATLGGVVADTTRDYFFYGAGATVPYSYQRSIVSVGVHYASSSLRNTKRNMVFFTVGVLLH
ncbi:MAG TPA: hypothetical protein VHO24_21175 [Opitutaceae bacterium]|nr:hypothetical protein [Opitutaceae bacterium]